MKYIRLSRFCALFLSFTLLFSSFPLMAMIESFLDNQLQHNAVMVDDSTYVHLDRQPHSIAEFVSVMCAIDEDETSPFHELNGYIEEGLMIVERNEILRILEYADWFLEQDKIKQEQCVVLQDTIDDLIEAIVGNHLTVDDEQVIVHKSKYPLWVVHKRLLVKGKTKLDSELIVKGKARFHDRTRFYKKAHFKENIVVDGVASLNDAVIQNLDLAGGLTLSDVTLTSASIADAVIDNLTVTNCIPHLCVEDLSVVDGSVSGTLSINDAVVQNLDLAGGLTISDITLTTASIADAVIDNLTVTNCVPHLCVEDLSVVDGSVSGTLSINDAVIQNLDLAGGLTLSDVTLTTASIADAVIDNLTVNNCVAHLCVEDLSVVDGSVSGTLSINDAVIQNLDLAGGLTLSDVTLVTASIADAVVDNLTVVNCVTDLCVENLSVVNGAVSGTFSANDAIIQHLDIAQNSIHFLDFLGINYVGMSASTTVPTSYSVQLPSISPIAGQVLRANATTPTQLEWATTGEGIPPAVSQTIYVTQYGNDSTGNGSFDAPYLTLSKAVDVANGIASMVYPVVIFMGPGIYVEDNSIGPISINAQGISIIGDTTTAISIIPSTVSNDLLLVNQTITLRNMTFFAPGGSTAAGIYFAAGQLSNINDLRVFGFQSGIICSGGATSSYVINNCLLGDNAVGLIVNNTNVECNACTILGTSSLSSSPVNTGMTATGAGATVVMNTGSFVLCNNGIDVSNNTTISLTATVFKFNIFDVIVSAAARATLTGCSFEITNSPADIDVQFTGVGTLGYLIGCEFNGSSIIGSPEATGIVISDNAFVEIDGGTLTNYTTGMQIGVPSDSSSTILSTNAFAIRNCTTDIEQQGSASVNFNAGIASASKLIINDPTNAFLSFFNLEDNNALTIGSMSNMKTDLIGIALSSTNNPHITYSPSIYSTQAVGFQNTFGSASSLYIEAAADAELIAITTNRNNNAGIKLVSDTASPVGGTSALRGWDIYKNGTTAELIFKYQNSDPLLLGTTLPYTVMQLDGKNNQVQLPTAATQVVFAGDTNLYRSAASVLKTDNNFIVGTLTPGCAVVTNGMTNQLASSVTTATEVSYLSGVTSAIQPQLNNKVSRSGDTMTGTLQLPAGTTANPSLVFTGSTTTGLSANTGSLSLNTNGLERMKITSGGTVSIDNFTVAGVVHNDASGNLSSSLIVNADVSPTAAIVDTKLATIATAGKVANSATTATSANTAGAIVVRDASGNFSAGTITANLSGNAATATSAGSFSGSLSGDVTGTQNATVVSFVGGKTAADIANATAVVDAATNAATANTLVLRDGTGSFSAHDVSMVDSIVSGSAIITPFTAAGVVHNNASGLLSSSLIVNADVSSSAAIVDTKLATISTAGKVANSATTATSGNTANAIVARDSSGNFSAGTITANLSGNATTATTATNFSGILAGDVTGVQSATVVSLVGGKTAADVANATTVVDAATNAAMANTLVLRDGTGSFAAHDVSMVDLIVSGSATITPFNTAGIVHNNASGLLSSSLIVNADVSATAAIADTKLATISTAGKVANSATTATSANTANAIVARDSSGNFSAGTITANLTGSASNNVLKAGDTMTGALTMANQAQIDFQDLTSHFVGLQAPASISTNYTLALPSDAPVLSQTLRSGSVVPTSLEWVTEGGAIAPAISRVIYVTQYGNDVTGDGSFDLPYASLSKALDLANSLSSVADPITIAMYPGVYIENNSAGPLIVSAQGISIIGDSPTSVIIMPNTLSNDFLLINQAIIIGHMGIVSGGVSTATGLSITSGSLSEFINLRIIGFQIGALCNGSALDNYAFENCFITDNGIGLSVVSTITECYNCTFLGSSGLSLPANTGINATGAGAVVIMNGGACGICNVGFNIENGAFLDANAVNFEFNIFPIVQTTGAQLNLSGSSFQYNVSGSDVAVQISGAGTVGNISGCKFNGNDTLGNPEGTAIIVSNNAVLTITSSDIANYVTGLQVGITTDTATTLLSGSSLTINNCISDIVQNGSSTLRFISSIAGASKISINDATNIQAAFFDMDDNSALTIGSSADMDTVLLQPYISQTNHPRLEFLASLYSTQGMGFNNEFGFPTTVYALANNNATVAAVTTLRTDIAGVRLVSDTASPVGGTTALRGWDINKNGSSAELSFNYQNSDPAGQSVISEYTVMQLDGVNNQLQLPTAGTKIVFGGDTNLYRSSAGVLKTNDNLIVGTLTPGKAVITDPVTNELASSVVTSTELSFLSGVTSNVQTQLNGKVSKTGDIMTGALQLPPGMVTTPSLTFTGSTTTGLSSPTANTLSLSTNGAQALSISSTGVVALASLTPTAGVVHNDTSGNLSSSKIVDADIASATIMNDKLATISSGNTSGAIVVRDGSGNFQTNQITILGSVVNPTDAATKSYVDTAVSTGLVVKNPALVASTTNVTISGLQTIDGVALSTNDRVLLVGQTNPVQNGLWLAQAGAWTRPADFASGTETDEAYVLVTSGATNAGASWVCNTPTAIIDTDPLGFEQFSLPSTTTGANVGAGTGLIYQGKTGVTLNFRSLIAGIHLTYTTNTSDVTLTTDATNANTASAIVARDASGNFSAGTITANLTGSASNNVLKTGDTMTGALTLPVGTVLAPSLNFTGSTTTGLSAPTANTLSFSTNGSQSMSISSAGVVAINNLTPAGVVHNDASGNLSSSLIVNADISNSAAIADTKLATISTAGKVANSATSATSANTANTIVLRDGSGNFNANIITATLNGSATNNVLKAGDTMTGTLQLPAGSSASPSLTFTGSTTAGLSASGGSLSLNTNGAEQMKISSGGVISIDGFTSAGVVHNDASGNLSTSLIVNADVDPAAGIIDTKLATISTAGKVANSATTATSANTASTIVLRDASGNFSAGTITANLNGNATTATMATNFSGSLSGDVTGTQSATEVSFVGGKTAADVANATAVVDAATNAATANTLVLRDGTGSFAAHDVSMVDSIVSGSAIITPFNAAGVVHNNASGSLSSSLIVNADVSTSAAIVDTKLATISSSGKVANSATTATSGNTANAIVARDASGNFSAGTITANLSGNATTATMATNFSGSLAGDVTGTQSATVVSFVGGKTAVDVANATAVVDAATNAAIANTLVLRDGTGSFAAQNISMVDEVATGSITVTPFNTAGVVHNNASGLLSSSLIVNADVSASAAIVDTKLATISTVGKVANSATTATSANIANAIVARDSSGNFSAGTITANLTGSASNNVLKAGDTMTGTLTMANQNQIDFQDLTSHFVGLQAPASVPTSYTVSLPSTSPSANQVLRANATTSTLLEWATLGGLVTPAIGETVYVAKYGNDTTGNGSFDSPYATLAKAVNVANGLATVNNPITIFINSGIYIENNSAGPITVTAPNISIVGSARSAVTLIPSTLSNNFILLTQTALISHVTLSANGVSTAAGIVATAGAFSYFSEIRVANFQTGLSCSGTGAQYSLQSCLFSSNGTAILVNSTAVGCNACSFLGTSSFASPAANTGIHITGSGGSCLVNGGIIAVCINGIQTDTNGSATVSSVSFSFNKFDVASSSSSQCAITGCNFTRSSSASDIKIQASGAGTLMAIEACTISGLSALGVVQGTGIYVNNDANARVTGCNIANLTTGFLIGAITDASTTIASVSSTSVNNCSTDIQQQGSSTLAFTASSATGSKVIINDPTNVTLAYFNIADNSALTIGSTGNMNTTVLQVDIDPVNTPSIEYLSSLYSTQAVGFLNLFGNPSSLYVEANADAKLIAITTDRADVAGVRLVSDTASPVGGTTALRGWDIIKNGSAAQLAFNYQNNDAIGQAVIPQFTVMQLDGVNNQVQLPTAGTEIVFGGDTNLYRSSANVLKTNDNLIVGTLTPGKAVITDPATNELASSVVTSTELSFLSGVTSSIQTQLNNKVSRSGDTMTGTLQLPAGSTASPSLVFTGSTTTGLSASAGNLSFSTNGAEAMKISSGGVVSIDAFTAAGVVHNDVSGNLSSSQIVNADISPTAGITDNKLATISTVGKVANSATSATSANTANAIVARDATGNFSAGTITANLNGNATTATSTGSFSGSLSGDVTGTQSATVVSFVGGVTAANVASGANAANAATSANTANTIVKRDASGNFSAGTITANLNGNATTATTATTATNFSGSLSGDVTGTQSATVVSFVGGVTAANVASGANAANAATSANTANTIVKRDASGNFSASTITANLNGNATTATTATTATNFSGSLAGDVTGTQSATVVSTVGGVTAANVASGANAANAATNLNTASTIVKRDGTGSFAAQNISMVDGIASGFLSIPTTASLSVGTIQQNGVSLIHTLGTNNTFVGQSAGNFTMSGTGNNTAVGKSSLSANTTGMQNTVVGASSGAAVTTGSNNVLVGYSLAGNLTTGSNNVYIDGSGLTPAFNESNTIRIGNTQTAVFMQGLFGVSVTSPQVAMVSSSGQLGSATAVSLGTSSNTASTLVARDGTGSFTAQNISMVDGIASGFLSIPTTASLSVGTIQQNGVSLIHTFGTNNTFVGQSAGNFTMSGTGNNTAVGKSSLSANTTGMQNTVVGASSGAAVTTGSNNVLVGYSLAGNLTTGSNNVYIDGSGLTPAFNESNTIRIGNTQTAVFMQGLFGVSVTSPQVAMVSSSGQLGSATAVSLGTSSNTASTLVARDASGNFSAGTITASLTGSASNNVLKAGDTMTGTLQLPAGTAASPSLVFTGSTNTGLSAATANRLSFDTNGVERMAISTTNIIDAVPHCNQALLVNTTLSTGGTITTTAATSILLINTGAVINNCTIIFPPSPTNGQYFTIISGQSQAINSITNTGGTGAATIVNPITALNPTGAIAASTGGAAVSYFYYSTNNAWYRMTRG